MWTVILPLTWARKTVSQENNFIAILFCTIFELPGVWLLFALRLNIWLGIISFKAMIL